MNNSPSKVSKQISISGICLLILSLALAVGTQSVFRACGIHEDGSYGRCHYAQLVVGLIALLMAAGAVLILLLRTREVFVAISVLTICESVLTLLIPGKIIPLCMMSTMSCLARMKPFAMTMSIVILLFSGCNLLLALLQRRNHI